MTGDDPTAEKQLFRLIVLAEKHHASVVEALSGLKAERGAWAQEREALQRELERWAFEARRAVHVAVQIELRNATEKSVAAAQSAVTPVAAQMERVAEQAATAEKAVIGITEWIEGQTMRWIRWLVPAGLATGLVAMLLAWAVSSWRMHADAQAIADMGGKRQQVEAELATAQENVAAWKRRAPSVQPIPCGPSHAYWCVRTYPERSVTWENVPDGWGVLDEGRGN